MIMSKLGRRGQVTLPKEIRRMFDIREGDRVAFLPRGGQVVLQPPKRTLLDLRGSVPAPGPPDLRAVRQQVRQHWSRLQVVHMPVPAGGLSRSHVRVEA